MLPEADWATFCRELRCCLDSGVIILACNAIADDFARMIKNSRYSGLLPVNYVESRALVSLIQFYSRFASHWALNLCIENIYIPKRSKTMRESGGLFERQPILYIEKSFVTQCYRPTIRGFKCVFAHAYIHSTRAKLELLLLILLHRARNSQFILQLYWVLATLEKWAVNCPHLWAAARIELLAAFDFVFSTQLKALSIVSASNLPFADCARSFYGWIKFLYASQPFLSFNMMICSSFKRNRRWDMMGAIMLNAINGTWLTNFISNVRLCERWAVHLRFRKSTISNCLPILFRILLSVLAICRNYGSMDMCGLSQPCRLLLFLSAYKSTQQQCSQILRCW